MIAAAVHALPAPPPDVLAALTRPPADVIALDERRTNPADADGPGPG